MKKLNIYINESLLDDEEDLINDDSMLIEKFIKDNFYINGKLIINNKVANVTGGLSAKTNIISLTNGLFKWGYVTCNVELQYCKNLTSLEGGPTEVGGDYYVYKCPLLKSLKGAPQQLVNGMFSCHCCENLKSLEGAPKYVSDDFYCDGCSKLTSLEGAPKKVQGDFNCDQCENLKSLEGAPKYVGGDFSFISCKNLTSLKGFPKTIVRKILSYDCPKIDKKELNKTLKNVKSV